MWDLFVYWHDHMLGLSVADLTVLHMVARAGVVYLLGIMILNLINKRFIGEKTSFDVILNFISGSSLASAIVGSSPYWPTLGMVFFLVLLNWLLSLLSFYSNSIEKLLKGGSEILYAHGKLQWDAMRRCHFTHEDILSEVRKITGLATLDHIETIIFESSGEISVIPKKSVNLAVNHTLSRSLDNN